MFKSVLQKQQARQGPDRRAARMVLQGQRLHAVAPGRADPSPAFAQDAGEEPEIAGIYVIGEQRHAVPARLCAGQRILRPRDRARQLPVLAHSKLRNCVLRPRDPASATLPDDIRGMSRILRDGKALWEKPFLSGEANMSPHHRQPRTPPLQIRLVPPAGRRPRPYVRHRDAELRRRHPGGRWRRVRDLGAGLWRLLAETG